MRRSPSAVGRLAVPTIAASCAFFGHQFLSLHPNSVHFARQAAAEVSADFARYWSPAPGRPSERGNERSQVSHARKQTHPLRASRRPATRSMQVTQVVARREPPSDRRSAVSRPADPPRPAPPARMAQKEDTRQHADPQRPAAFATMESDIPIRSSYPVFVTYPSVVIYDSCCCHCSPVCCH